MKRETLQNATFLIWLAGGILAATIVLIANSMGIDSFTIEPTDLTSIENRLRKVLDQETVNGAMADLEESVKGRLLETRTKDQMRVELLKDLPQGLDEKTIGQIVMSSKRRVIGIYYSRVLELYLPWIVIMAAALFKEEERVVVYRRTRRGCPSYCRPPCRRQSSPPWLAPCSSAISRRHKACSRSQSP